MGHTWVAIAGAHGDLQQVATWVPRVGPHRAPDSKIQWAPWMANEGQSHGQQMGCQ